ncbi:hypothetical protein R1sor_013032 [Riccia sorocarpa]|uniref:Uncharacterized protein n=1 Tax=Riccia sorocarpa TaxID=122646 RepID=A0ABD3H5X9_9MARC
MKAVRERQRYIPVLEKKPKPMSASSFTEIVAHRKPLMPLLPLFGMVSLAFGLAGMTAFRLLATSPTTSVAVNKKTRATDDQPEMSDPEGVAQRGRLFLETSPLYKFSKGSDVGAATAKIQQQPPVLPGDESSAIGVQGTYVNRGARQGGI